MGTHGWERLRSTSGPRLVSRDDAVQIGALRRTDGPHKGWLLVTEWLEDLKSWHYIQFDDHRNVVAQVFAKTRNEAFNTINSIVERKGLGTRMAVLTAAKEILKEEGKPLYHKDITERAMKRGLFTPKGKTPEATMQAALAVAAKAGDGVERVAPGMYALK